MATLRLLLRTAPKRCARSWYREGPVTSWWHTCTAPPGHGGDHTCPGTPGKPCRARLAQAGAA